MIQRSTIAEQYTADLSAALATLPPMIDALADLLCEARARGALIACCGNGGSAATAAHFAEDLAKGVTARRNALRLRAVALCDSVPLLTAYANDCGYEKALTNAADALLSSGDVLVAFSGSGNSPNILRALWWAASCGVTSIAIGGRDGGEMKGIANHSFIVPAESMPLIEDCHLALCHAVCEVLKEKCNG
jgi:D-sedoheptulose 7-phosphate isomerase